MSDNDTKTIEVSPTVANYLNVIGYTFTAFVTLFMLMFLAGSLLPDHTPVMMHSVETAEDVDGF